MPKVVFYGVLFTLAASVLEAQSFPAANYFLRSADNTIAASSGDSVEILNPKSICLRAFDGLTATMSFRNARSGTPRPD